ncbi:MAG: sugar phosphate isomerase/epimerase family protein [Phycisphaerae bacterium]
MIRISYCTIAFQKNKWGKDRLVEKPIEEIWPIVADAGYDGIEIWYPHVEMLDGGALGELAGQLEKAGLEVAMLSPYFDFTSSEESVTASIQRGGEAIAAARTLGARGIRCFTGKVGSADADEAQWHRAICALQTLADQAPDLLWALETHPHNLMDTLQASLNLIRRVDRPNVVFIFQPSTFADEPIEALKQLAPWTRHVHATNLRDKQRTLLAEGEMDWPAIVQGLRDRGVEGYISVEWMGDEPAEVARTEATYLRSLLAK